MSILQQFSSGGQVDVGEKADISVGRGVRIVSSRLVVPNGASLHLGENALIDKCDLVIDEGCSLIVDTGSSLHGTLVRVRYEGSALRIGREGCFNNGGRIFCYESIQIGDYCLVAANTFISDSQCHSLDWKIRREALKTQSAIGWPGREPKPRSAPLKIGDDCWLGHGAQILVAKSGESKLSLGARSIVGAGAIVKSSFPSDSLIVGSPARRAKQIG